MLRIAVPNKGSLAEPAADMLREAGYRQRRDARELVLLDAENDVEFFFLRPRDIAVYVGAGTVDAGITGRDLLADSGAHAVEHLALGFGRSTFRYAAPPGVATSLADVVGKRVATSYELLVANHLRFHGVQATVVHLDGAVESAVQLGVADVVADVVSTGTTLRGAGLEAFGHPILVSEAILIRPGGMVGGNGTPGGEGASFASATPTAPGAIDSDRVNAGVIPSGVGAHNVTAPVCAAAASSTPAGLDVLTRRLQGVLTAHEYVLMDYDVPTHLVERAVTITPGLESPTVSPLHRRGWCAVRVMVRRENANQVMDALYDVGARGILVTSIHACRL